LKLLEAQRSIASELLCGFVPGIIRAPNIDMGQTPLFLRPLGRNQLIWQDYSIRIVGLNDAVTGNTLCEFY
jgi:hypothetical protein